MLTKQSNFVKLPRKLHIYTTKVSPLLIKGNSKVSQVNILVKHNNV